MKHFLLALQFMTRYRVRAQETAPEPQEFGRASGYFPLVGLLVGLELLLFRALTLKDPVGMHQPLWAVLLLLYWVWVCDSLHLDGLADTCDALATRREGKEMLEILHDPRLGAFGAMGLGLALLARWAWLRYLPMQFIWFLPLPLITSRLFSSLACQIRPYAGRPGSLSSGFITQSRHSDANGALGWSFASFILLAAPCIYFAEVSAMDAGVALAICGCGVMAGWAALQLPLRRLGGISGDLIGFGQVITELSTAFGLFFALVR
jgi:adenosylcobinamide-GDP ribazoletransferase